MLRWKRGRELVHCLYKNPRHVYQPPVGPQNLLEKYEKAHQFCAHVFFHTMNVLCYWYWEKFSAAFQAGSSPWKDLRQDPLGAILVIFGRRALTFFFWRLLPWKNMKNDTTLCACAVVIILETQKNVEKGHLAPSNLTFLLIAIDWNGFRRMKEEGQIYKNLPQIF